MNNYPKVLSIAGSDSGGGAGIQADIKTITSLGGYATTAITAVTSQNTLGVQSVEYPSAQVVASQVRSVLEDIGSDAVKIGMLPTKDIISAVAWEIRGLDCPLVIDPVMVSSTGSQLLETDALAPLMRLISDHDAIVTPNLHEAEILLSRSVKTKRDMHAAAVALQATFGGCFLVKGGHLESAKGYDVLVDGNGRVTPLETPQIHTNNVHGTGCTLSSAIAFYLARGFDVVDAVRKAKEYLSGALAFPLGDGIGGGCGPVCHNYRMLKTRQENR